MIKTLQLLDSYLPNTENWIYSLLSNCLNCEKHIGAFKFLDNPSTDKNFILINKARDTHYDLRKVSTSKGLTRISELIKIKINDLTKKTTQQKLIKYCKDNKIEVLHAHFANVGWEMLEVKKKTKLPFLVSFYGWDYEMLPHVRPEFKQRYQILFKEADGFICEGHHGASILERLGCNTNKIHIVPLGVDVQNTSFLLREKKSQQLQLLQLASYTEKKGHLYSIRAFSEAMKDCPNMHLTFIGNQRKKGLLDKLKREVEMLKLDSHVTFLPAIDYKEINETLAYYDVFIHPSCYTKERDCEGGAPIVFLDAQATGMPIISTRHCDIPSEVIHNQTGILTQEKNIQELSNAIKNFYKMGNKEYQRFALAARKHVEKNYDTQITSKMLEGVYQNFI